MYQSFGEGEKFIPKREVFVDFFFWFVGWGFFWFWFFFFFASHFYVFISALAELKDSKVFSSVNYAHRTTQPTQG